MVGLEFIISSWFSQFQSVNKVSILLVPNVNMTWSEQERLFLYTSTLAHLQSFAWFYHHIIILPGIKQYTNIILMVITLDKVAKTSNF